MHRSAVIAALIFATTSCAGRAAARVFSVVSPASGELVTSHFAGATYVERTLSRAATGDTTERESVVARIDEIVGSDGPDATIERVTTGHYSGGDYFDSIVVRRRDLLPIRERFAYVQRRIEKRFAYDGGTVHQVNTSADSTKAFDRAYELRPSSPSMVSTARLAASRATTSPVARAADGPARSTGRPRPSRCHSAGLATGR